MLFGVKFAFLLATVATLLQPHPHLRHHHQLGAHRAHRAVPELEDGPGDALRGSSASTRWRRTSSTRRSWATAARIHPVMVAFALIAGERTYGLLGALFAVPVAAIVVACFDFARLKAQPSPSLDAPGAPERLSSGWRSRSWLRAVAVTAMPHVSFSRLIRRSGLLGRTGAPAPGTSVPARRAPSRSHSAAAVRDAIRLLGADVPDHAAATVSLEDHRQRPPVPPRPGLPGTSS